MVRSAAVNGPQLIELKEVKDTAASAAAAKSEHDGEVAKFDKILEQMAFVARECIVFERVLRDAAKVRNDESAKEKDASPEYSWYRMR